MEQDDYQKRKQERKEHYLKYVYKNKLRECTACSGSGFYRGGSCGCCDGTGKERER